MRRSRVAKGWPRGRGNYGYEIAARIDAQSGGTLRLTLASLYATLHRLEERDLIRGRGWSAPGSGGGAAIG